MVGIPALIALAVVLLIGLAELWHHLRVRRIARLLFGSTQRPAPWVRLVPFLRMLAGGALVWGLLTLLQIEPKKHGGGVALNSAKKSHDHILMVLDVSPSMRLVDSGPDRKQSRTVRARRVMESFFRRVPLEQFRVSVVAVYNGAKPVVIETSDMEVVQNLLSDLPMHYAFPSGKTKLFEGLREAVDVARNWPPRSTTLIIVSDGDTVPATGMPKLPASIGHTLVVGVGDPITGEFIDGRQSRQDVSTLRQIATRLGGTYHNGNEKHLSSTWLEGLAPEGQLDRLAQLTRREYALIACGSGAVLFALLPVFLTCWGTSWRPGVRRKSQNPKIGPRQREALQL